MTTKRGIPPCDHQPEQPSTTTPNMQRASTTPPASAAHVHGRQDPGRFRAGDLRGRKSTVRDATPTAASQNDTNGSTWRNARQNAQNNSAGLEANLGQESSSTPRKKVIRRMNFRLTLEGRGGPRSRGRSPSIRPATTELRPQHHPSTAWAWKTLSKNVRAYRGRVRTTGNPPRLTTAGAARSGAAATTTTRWMGRGGRFLEATRRRPDDGAMVVMSARIRRRPDDGAGGTRRCGRSPGGGARGVEELWKGGEGGEEAAKAWRTNSSLKEAPRRRRRWIRSG